MGCTHSYRYYWNSPNYISGPTELVAHRGYNILILIFHITEITVTHKHQTEVMQLFVGGLVGF